MPQQDRNEDGEVDADQPQDTGIACLVILLRFFAMAGNAEQIRHQFGQTGKPLESGDLVRAARSLELKSRVVETSWDRFEKNAAPSLGGTQGWPFRHSRQSR